MISIRTLTPVCLFAAGALALAQPQPPTPPTPAPRAVPAPAPPASPAPPAPGMHMLMGPAQAIDLSDLTQQLKELGQMDMGVINDQVRASLKNLDVHVDVDMDAIREQVDAAREQVDAAREQVDAARKWELYGQNWGDFAKGFAFMPQVTHAPAMPPMPPMPPQPRINYNYLVRGGNANSLYERGLSALDRHQYDQALDYFTEVATRAQAHADGALYWKAYTLNKLGRRDDANAALAELRKAYPSSHWLDDAKALELEVKQSSGQKVSPEAESNDDLKLLALEGLAQSDPDRAFPLLDQLLKKAQSPNFKRRAVYVLALSNSPRAQQLLEQIARGGGNPDMQIAAIRYLGASSKNANKSQVLSEIYSSSSDADVKREVMSAMLSNHDKDHLLAIAKSDKDKEMRQEALRKLASLSAAPDMWALYQAETDSDVRRTILDYMSGSTDKLMEVVKTEKDPKLRRSAIQRLGSVKSNTVTDALVAVYGSEPDPQVKRTIVDGFVSGRNAAGLVAVARKENDLDQKRYIVRRMLELKSSPEINQFLEEILK